MTKPGTAVEAQAPADLPERSIGWYLWRGVSAGVFAVVALVAALVVVVPAVAGASTFTITGSSMEPTLPIGTLIVTRPVETGEIAVGDVITFQLESGQPQVATHRVVGVEFAGDGSIAYRTKGDANDAVDGESVQAEQVRGRLWYSVPLLGWVNYVLTGSVRAWIMPIVAGGLCLYAGWMFVGAVRDHRAKRGGAPASPAADPGTRTEPAGLG